MISAAPVWCSWQPIVDSYFEPQSDVSKGFFLDRPPRGGTNVRSVNDNSRRGTVPPILSPQMAARIQLRYATLLYGHGERCDLCFFPFLRFDRRRSGRWHRTA